MIKLILFFLILLNLYADENLDLKNDFLNSLDEVSEIATKTKLNIDDTPSFVTVLHREKLSRLGIDNVFEALALVPGVQLKKEATGVPVVVFRGVTQKGEVKLMIDGVSINNFYRGSIYYYLDFPIEMVKRIEVIRGAGSVLYGSGAISGVINIITNSSENSPKNKVCISGGTYNNYKAGMLVSTNINRFKISLDGYYQKHDKTIYIDANQFGDSDRHLKDYSAGINITDNHFSFLGRIKKSDISNAYGVLGVLDKDKNRYANKNESIFTQLSYKNRINKENKITLLAGYNNYTQEVPTVHSTQGDIDAFYEEDSYYSEINLISTSLKNNELLLGARYETAKTKKSIWEHTSLLLPMYISDPNLSRNTTSIYMNNTYSVLPSIDISAGLRYDKYSDFGDSYSPNLGIVYRLSEQIRLKALYAHSFRAPSGVELTSNKNLEAESSDSIEAGIVFKNNSQNALRVNFYTSRIKDMILKDSTGQYMQNSQNKFYGTELEYIYSPSSHTELNFFASYIKAKDAKGDDLSDVANILTSASLTYELGYGFTIGSLLKYVSSSKRSQIDSRNKMDDSLIFDHTVSYSYNSFTARFIIKDLFDAGTYYALPKNSYNKDFDDGGRTFLLKASIKF